MVKGARFYPSAMPLPRPLGDYLPPDRGHSDPVELKKEMPRVLRLNSHPRSVSS